MAGGAGPEGIFQLEVSPLHHPVTLWMKSSGEAPRNPQSGTQEGPNRPCKLQPTIRRCTPAHQT